MSYLTDLADVARTSGLQVVEVPGWRTRGRPAYTGGFDPEGWLDHHTGSYDSLTDAENDFQYAEWLAKVGRPDLPPPLCNLALSAECVVYVVAAGRANHAGTAKATGPMPAGDGNKLYGGTEAMNSGSQGWDGRGEDASGNPVTQGEALARLDAALAKAYGWPASHVRGHKETSVTGKWDPGLLDMDAHRAAVARLINTPEDDMPSYTDWSEKDRDALTRDVSRAILREKVKVLSARGKPIEVTLKQAIARTANGTRRLEGDVDEALERLDELNRE